jgi:hypothetical protein
LRFFQHILFLGLVGSFLGSTANAWFDLGAGVLVPHLGQFSGADSGKTELLSPRLAEVDAVFRWKPKSGKWGIAVAGSYTPLAYSLAESGESLRVLRGTLSLERGLFSFLDLNTGLGLMGWRISGNGGSVTLDNGNSTADFALPSRTVTARSLYLQGGVSLHIWRLRLENLVLLSGPLTSRQTWSAVSQLTMRVW